MDPGNLDRGKELAKELAALLRLASDSEVMQILSKESAGELVSSILDTSTWRQDGLFADFLLQRRNRAALVMSMARHIRSSFTLVREDGEDFFYITPHSEQWVDGGIVLLVGEHFLGGEMVLWLGGQLLHAVLARAVQKGAQLVPEDFEFISDNEYQERLKTLQAERLDRLASGVTQLEELLLQRNNDESEYQALFQKHPWMFGARYSAVESHIALDDKNIPDFTAIRVHDQDRDIFEIKAPFIPNLFKSKGSELGSGFNDAWNQLEDYLDFAKLQRQYLGDKGLVFNNPKGYLLIGYDLSPEQLYLFRGKGRKNPAMEVMTYNDVLAVAKNVVELAQDRQSAQSNRGDTTLLLPHTARSAREET